MGPQLVNPALRAFTLASRLALLFFLARLLPPAEVGLYGLFLATVTYSVFAVGLDLYTHTQREILGRPRAERAGILMHHAGVTGMAYVVVVPAAMFAFAGGYLPLWAAPWFVVLLLSEHVAQEMNRVLIAVQRQLAAGVVLFVRQGAWIWVALAFMWFVPSTRGLELVFICWLAGCVSALAVGAWCLRRDVDGLGDWRWDWGWVGQGLRTGLLFLAATLCLRGILTFDRYLFQDFAGPDLLGVYTLYAAMALAVMNFMDAAVFIFRYPAMVQAWRHGRHEQYRDEWRRLVRQTALVLILLTVAAAVVGPLVAMLVGKPIYLENVDIFGWLLAGVCLQVLGMIPHYGLYAMRSDRPILAAHATGLVAFFACAFALSAAWPRLGTPVAVAAAFGWVLLVKLVVYRRVSARSALAAE